MSRLQLSVPFFDVTLSLDAWKTVAALKAGSDQILELEKLRFFTNGTDGGAEPINIRFVRITAASGTGTAVTPRKTNDGVSCNPRSTARVNFTVEPSESGTTPYLHDTKFHPQGGLIEDLTGDDFLVKEGTEIALMAKVPAGGSSSLKASGSLIYLE